MVTGYQRRRAHVPKSKINTEEQAVWLSVSRTPTVHPLISAVPMVVVPLVSILSNQVCVRY